MNETRIISPEGIEFFRIDEIDRSGIARTVFTPKEYPFGRDSSPATREALCRELDIDANDMIFAAEKHTAVVAEAARNADGAAVIDGHFPDGFDALITREKGILLCTLEADCVPVWLFDADTPAVAMIHSGWRGTAAGISANAVKAMSEKYGTDPTKLRAFIGPHICADCYEVGPELMSSFEKNFQPELVHEGFVPEYPGTESDRYLLNLKAFIISSLISSGVRPENIGCSDYCTCHSGLFNSYRRSGEKGKQMLTAVILK